MKTYLSHNTALCYWREHFPLDSELGLPARVTGAESCSSRKSDVKGPSTARKATQPQGVRPAAVIFVWDEFSRICSA